MNSIIARPAFSALSKRSIMVRSFSASPIRCFYNEEPKAHHQVAPLTEATVYAPQGHTSTASTSAPADNTTVVFSPTVNHVFDD